VLAHIAPSGLSKLSGRRDKTVGPSAQCAPSEGQDRLQDGSSFRDCIRLCEELCLVMQRIEREEKPAGEASFCLAIQIWSARCPEHIVPVHRQTCQLQESAPPLVRQLTRGAARMVAGCLHTSEGRCRSAPRPRAGAMLTADQDAG